MQAPDECGSIGLARLTTVRNVRRIRKRCLVVITTVVTVTHVHTQVGKDEAKL